MTTQATPGSAAASAATGTSPGVPFVAALRVEGLTHRYPASKRADSHNGAARPALDGVTLQVRAGEAFGLLGPNGSGKSTLFRIITTLLRPTEGRVLVFDRDPVQSPEDVRRRLGVVFQSPSLDGKLTARENLVHQGHLYGLTGADLNRRIDELLARFGMTDRADDFVERFSGGMRRRVELAKALLHEPQLLLMDEPATGLDPGARRDLWKQIDELRADRGITVVLTTHLMDEADRCDRLAIMSLGKVVAVDTPSALKARIGGDVITASPADPADAERLTEEIKSRFAPWPDGGEPGVVGGDIHMERQGGASFIATLTSAFAGRIASVRVGQPTLEDVFLHLTGHTLFND